MLKANAICSWNMNMPCNSSSQQAKHNRHLLSVGWLTCFLQTSAVFSSQYSQNATCCHTCHMVAKKVISNTCILSTEVLYQSCHHRDKYSLQSTPTQSLCMFILLICCFIVIQPFFFGVLLLLPRYFHNSCCNYNQISSSLKRKYIFINPTICNSKKKHK